MKSYLDVLERALKTGSERGDRTNTGTCAIFGAQIKHDLDDGFPALTTKAIHMHSVVTELVWMLRGDTNVAWLQARKVRIWNEWADNDGELGPVYGKQWKRWESRGKTIDQIEALIKGIKNDPWGRRHIVTAWNPVEVPDAALPPCHLMFQCLVDGNRRLHLVMTQRSGDLVLGIPFNVASYALLTHMIAHATDTVPGSLTVNIADAHVYLNHFAQARTQLARTPRRLPTLKLTTRDRLEDYTSADVILEGYDPHPAIKAPVAI